MLALALVLAGSTVGASDEREPLPECVREWMETPAWADFTAAVDDSINGLRVELEECQAELWRRQAGKIADQRDERAWWQRKATWHALVVGVVVGVAVTR